MDEEEKRKTRADFDTDSEWYTYQVTHPEETIEPIQIPQAVTLYYKCLNPRCDYLEKEELELTAKQFEKKNEELASKKCPKCGKRGFKLIDKKEYEKEKESSERKRKLAESNEKEAAKAIKYDIIKSIDKEVDEIKDYLKAGKITPKRCVALIFNAVFYEYNYNNKYNARNKYLNLSANSFREYALRLSDEIIQTYDIKEDYEDLLNEYASEKADKSKYLFEAKLELEIKKSIAENVQNVDMDESEIEELKRDISGIEQEIEVQEKLKEKTVQAQEMVSSKEQRKDKDLFKESLLKNVNK